MPQKIVIVHPNLNVKGGAERKILLIAQKILKSGYEAEFLCHRFSAADTFLELTDGLVISADNFSSKSSWMIRVFFKLLFARCELIIVSNYPANIPCALAGFFRPFLPILWVCNEVAPALSKKTTSPWRIIFWIERKISRRINSLIANSSFTATEIRAYYGRKAEVIRSGVEIREFIGEMQCRREVLDFAGMAYWLSVSRLEKHKNIQLIVRLAEANPGELFLIGGTGMDASWLLSKIKKLKNVRYLGPLSEDEKFFLMRNARGFLFLPEKEPLGVTVMESISQGTPVLAFNSGGPKEVILDGINGLLVADEKAFEMSLKHPIFNSRLAPEVSKMYITDKFSNQRMVKDFSNSIDAILRGR